MKVSRSRENINNWLAAMPDFEKVKIADVGCGNKPCFRHLKIKDCECIGFEVKPDVADEMIDLNTGFCPSQYIEYFDVVFCLETMEHVLFPQDAIKTLYHMLKPGGFLYMSWPWAYPEHGLEDNFRYTGDGMAKLCLATGFRATNIEASTASPEGSAKLLDFYETEGMANSHQFEDPEYGKALPIGFFLVAVK